MNEDRETIWLSPKEVADYLKLSIETIYRYINDTDNPLPSYKLSKSNIRIDKEELEQWIKEKQLLIK